MDFPSALQSAGSWGIPASDIGKGNMSGYQPFDVAHPAAGRGGAGPHGGAAQGEGEQDPQKVFSLIDKDGDGRITRAELTGRKTEIFYLRDADRDSRLSRAEFSTINPAAFDLPDLYGDGQLSGFELDQAPFVKFEAVDTDGDGVITLEEFQAFRHRMNRKHMPHAARGVFGAKTTDLHCG